jgi:predicted metalloprotease
MRWKRGRRSSNIEDRRGARLRTGLPGLFPGRLGGTASGRPRGRGSLVVTVLVLLGLYFLGVDPRLLLQSDSISEGPGSGIPGADSGAAPAARSPQEQELVDFVSVVLADTEDTWHALFGAMDQTYREPKLVLFSDLVQSGCGTAQSTMGPFYCPLDEKLYIDLSFYDELAQTFNSPGDFAQAYVIAHEVGHHVQNLLGISDKVQSARRRVGEAEGNQLSVRLELQADCLAGVWGYHADRSRQLLEEGDIEEALRAASSIGDDRLQRQSRGRVVPESFTHGSSEQRVRWFQRGVRSGTLEACNTFEVAEL